MVTPGDEVFPIDFRSCESYLLVGEGHHELVIPQVDEGTLEVNQKRYYDLIEPCELTL
jgi:hypothetical protein